MVNLKINGMDVSVPEGSTILEAARKLLANGSSQEGNQMLYDEFLAGAGDANDTDIH